MTDGICANKRGEVQKLNADRLGDPIAPDRPFIYGHHKKLSFAEVPALFSHLLLIKILKYIQYSCDF